MPVMGIERLFICLFALFTVAGVSPLYFISISFPEGGGLQLRNSSSKYNVCRLTYPEVI
jgi:hypothetical protein